MIAAKYSSAHTLCLFSPTAILALYICMETVVTKLKGNFVLMHRMEYLSELIKNNISLCTFDFSGCGNSEG
jgi:hypothetical protein